MMCHFLQGANRYIKWHRIQLELVVVELLVEHVVEEFVLDDP